MREERENRIKRVGRRGEGNGEEREKIRGGGGEAYMCLCNVY